MKRKDFLRKGFIGLSSIVAVPTFLDSCKKKDNEDTMTTNGCIISPTETKGPFPIKTPAQLVQANIVSDRTGVALLVILTIQNKNTGCLPLQGALVDIWHCDKEGNYSEYGGTNMQTTDYTNVHFLRGRQTTDANGQVSFISIYPGWYSSRAPHIHLEILSSTGTSLLVTQIAFPEDISKQVYGSSLYASHGQADTANSTDNVFSDSLANNMGSITGNVNDGFTLTKTIVVSA
jgi:protocatechuate 3,4-dioxygenase beta subunit